MTKILVIEDEDSIRYLIQEILETEDFEVIDAADGKSGIDLAQEQLPDVILCDVMMPGIDGYGVLRTLRQNPATATIPFIFLTALSSRADIRLGIEQGADDYLSKPFTDEELLGAVRARLKKQVVLNQRYDSLTQLAYYDPKTRLPNRLLLGERFHQLLTESKGRNVSIPILYIDLDRFHRINDTLGDIYADLLLRAVAERLQSCMGSQDTLAHLSEDQFAVILTPITAVQQQNLTAWHSAVARVAQSILDTLSQPFKLRSVEVFITTSIGIALYPQQGRELDSLIRFADIAMHKVKQQGGNQYQFYTAAIVGNNANQLALEASLHHALERSELRVYYQPLVDPKTEAIIGAETLLRWEHPERGLVSPSDFMPLAEETGLIVPMGEWAMRQACQQAKIWQAAGFLHFQLTVNLSARQFHQPNLIPMIAQVLQETGLDPVMLELEVTETALMPDPAAATTILNQLKTMGISLSLDDFGTGYSSLNYLQQFPFDTLKIDRSFVHNIAENAKNAAIVTAIIQMAHYLKLWVIAEGVETKTEFAFLRQYGCDAMQGYWFSRPLTAEAFTHFLKTRKRSSSSRSA